MGTVKTGVDHAGHLLVEMFLFLPHTLRRGEGLELQWRSGQNYSLVCCAGHPGLLLLPQGVFTVDAHDIPGADTV